MVDYDAGPGAIMVLKQMLREGNITFDQILEFGHRAKIDEKHVEGLEAELGNCVESESNKTDAEHNERDKWLELD